MTHATPPRAPSHVIHTYTKHLLTHLYTDVSVHVNWHRVDRNSCSPSPPPVAGDGHHSVRHVCAPRFRSSVRRFPSGVVVRSFVFVRRRVPFAIRRAWLFEKYFPTVRNKKVRVFVRCAYRRLSSVIFPRIPVVPYEAMKWGRQILFFGQFLVLLFRVHRQNARGLQKTLEAQKQVRTIKLYFVIFIIVPPVVREWVPTVFYGLPFLKTKKITQAPKIRSI